MSGLRPPIVAGVGGGVGVTTLAVALRGHDAGRAEVGAADILACRGTLDSLGRAADVLDRLGSGSEGTLPALAVSLDGPRLPRGPLRDRLEQLDAAASGIVLLPLVKRWRTLADPLPEAARLLVDPPEYLPRPLRSYAEALRELAAAVAASGRLAVRPERPERDGPARTARGGRSTRNPRDLDADAFPRAPRGPDREPAGSGAWAAAPGGRHRSSPARADAWERPRTAEASGWPAGGTAADAAPRYGTDAPPPPYRTADTPPLHGTVAGSGPAARAVGAAAAPAAPRVVGVFRPVVGAVTPAAAGSGRRRGVRVVTAVPRVPVPDRSAPPERIEQVG